MSPPPGAQAGPNNAITDVAGIRVGHHQRIGDDWLTGTTVILTPTGTTGGYDIRGGGPAVTDTALLDPAAMVQQVDAICLSGGSVYGLAAADGVRRWLGEHNVGLRLGPAEHHVVPIVPGAALFDLGAGGRFQNHVDAAFGYQAAAAAAASEPGAPIAQGTVGAGTGAHAGHLKGGIGSASVVLPNGVTVAALVALNSAGSPVNPADGTLWGAVRGLPGEFDLATPSAAEAEAFRTVERTMPELNTTLAVVATDAVLDKGECQRLAVAAHDGMARAIDPIHQYVDGDIAFALATGVHELPDNPPEAPRLAQLMMLGAASADVVARAIVHATLAATTARHLVSYRDTFPTGQDVSDTS